MPPVLISTDACVSLKGSEQSYAGKDINEVESSCFDKEIMVRRGLEEVGHGQGGPEGSPKNESKLLSDPEN